MLLGVARMQLAVLHSTLWWCRRIGQPLAATCMGCLVALAPMPRPSPTQPVVMPLLPGSLRGPCPRHALGTQCRRLCLHCDHASCVACCVACGSLTDVQRRIGLQPEPRELERRVCCQPELDVLLCRRHFQPEHRRLERVECDGLAVHVLVGGGLEGWLAGIFVR